MARKQDKNDYFAMFVRQAELSREAAEYILRFMQKFDADGLDHALREVHKIEQTADEVNQKLMQVLFKEFLPPIEAEDIMALAHELDNVTDSVEDTLRHVYMYNITQINQPALEFCALIAKQCGVLCQIMEEFRSFAKSKVIHEYTKEINHLEEAGDELYTKCMRELFSKETDPREIIIWSNMYDAFELCCDTCEHAAEVVENAIMKNT